MKKTLIATILSLTTALSVASEKINFINPYPPGGGNDQTIQALKPALEKRGFTIETTYLKSCNQGIDMLKNSTDKHTYMMFPNTAISSVKDEAFCHLNISKLEKMELLTSVFTGGLYLCTASGKNVSNNDLLNKNLKVAVTTDFSMRYLKDVTSKFKNSLELVPYRSTSDLIRAVNAGDVDLWFSSSINVLKKDDTKCFGSTFKDNPFKIKFIGDLTSDKKYPEYKTMWLIFTNKNSVEKDELFKSALNSEESKKFIESRASVHTGILVDPDRKNDLNYIVESEKFFMSLPK